MFSDPTSKSAAMINSPIKNETVDCAIVRATTRTTTERNVDVFHHGHNSTNGIVNASTQTNCVFQTLSLYKKFVTQTRKLHFMLPEMALLPDIANYNNARANCPTTTRTYIRNRFIHCFFCASVSSSYYATSNDRLINEQ